MRLRRDAPARRKGDGLHRLQEMRRRKVERRLFQFG